MERRLAIVQRTRDCFGEHLDQILQMVQQDRQELYGWQEPAHLRAVLRRAVGTENSGANQMATMPITEPEIVRGAGEPEQGQQREALGQILEAGAAGLEKTRHTYLPDLTAGELAGLECILLLYGRPGLLVSQGRMAQPPAFWNLLEDQRDDIELTQRAVGRIDLVGHPDYDWAGTGFLVSDTCLMTTRAVAQVFVERSEDGEWQFRPGISGWMEYQPDYQRPASATYRLNRVLGVHNRYDVALLEVEPPQQNGAPAPLSLAAEPPLDLEGRPVYLISYPLRDARRAEPESIARIFRDDYNVKRIQPGMLRGSVQFRDVHLLLHDCAPLGHSSGGCLLDLETHRVLGLHVSSRYLENGTAVPLWMLQDDPLFQRCGVTYTRANAQELQAASSQVERLARSRLWDETRQILAQLYERAFGKVT